DLPRTKYLLEADGDVHVEGCRALILACAAGHVDVVKYLISKGAHINVRSGLPLRRACIEGQTEVVRVLLEKGANPMASQEQFIAAVRSGVLDVVRMMIDAGVAVYRTIHITLPSAAWRGHINIVKLLFEHVGNPDISDLRCSVLFAYQSRHNDIASLVFEKYHREATLADLIDAATWGHLPNVDRLLGDGVADDGQALQKAIARGHLSIVKLLLYIAFDAYLWQNFDESIKAAHEAGYSGCIEQILCYLKKDSRIESRIHGPCHSGLESAVHNGHTETISILLKNGLDPNFKSGILLHIAAEKGHIFIITSLLQHGASPNTRLGSWAIVRASEAGHAEIVKLLLEVGKNHYQDGDGGVILADALRLAVDGGHVQVVEVLLEARADVGHVVFWWDWEGIPHPEDLEECRG
ncbi:hypothetical protein HK097_005842, partial [Rhizophlyctis rosea]